MQLKNIIMVGFVQQSPIDDAFIDVGGISRLGNSSLFNPSITFPADSFGNTGFYYHNYKD